MQLEDRVDGGLRVTRVRIDAMRQPLEDHPSLFSADRNFSQPLAAEKSIENLSLPSVGLGGHGHPRDIFGAENRAADFSEDLVAEAVPMCIALGAKPHQVELLQHRQ